MKDDPVFEYHTEETLIDLSLPDGQKQSVIIKPGWAFGTGDHETTRLCIKMLENLFTKRKIKKVLDIGCGSGILSVCAAFLGAEKVIGIDLDSSIINEANLNASKNGISEKTDFTTSSIRDIQSIFDLICANILLKTINSLRLDIVNKLNNDGVFLASGIKANQKTEAVQMFQELGLILIDEHSERDWIALVFSNN